MIHSHKDLIVWQRSIDLVTAIYQLTDHFPKQEIYGLTSQMRRAAVSIPSNIAEGRYRGSKRDYSQFLRTAFASGAELETQIVICKKLPHLKELNYAAVDQFLDEVMRMLNVMIRKLNPHYES
jgi:four helix bundle protein